MPSRLIGNSLFSLPRSWYYNATLADIASPLIIIIMARELSVGLIITTLLVDSYLFLYWVYKECSQSANNLKIISENSTRK